MACARSYRKRLRQVAEMSPLEAWYAHIGLEEYLGLIDDPAHQKRVRRDIDKATQGRASDLDYPKLAKMVGGVVQIKDQPPLIYHMDLQRQEGFAALMDKSLARPRSPQGCRECGQDRRSYRGRQVTW